MSVRCLVIVLPLICFAAAARPGFAEELAGKLERVDYETVTLIGSDNQKTVVRVDKGNRHKAATFLGKTVTVDVRSDRGECRAIRFRSGN